jgi:hypothetical protein
VATLARIQVTALAAAGIKLESLLIRPSGA